ncbi:MAG: PQQ-dependent dehydrogenase, methanol/ethanol family, partial [Woeseiales bacterium]
MTLINTRQTAIPLVLLATICILTACSEDSSPIEATSEDAEAGVRPVTGERIVNADAEPGNWLSTGRTYDEQRFSPLTKINEDNVADLGLAWYFDIDTNRAMEATPLVADGVMYV